MSELYSDDLREYLFSAEPEIAALVTIEFRNPLFLDEDDANVAVRIVNRAADFEATLEDGAPMNGGETVRFQAAGFDFTPPESSDQGLPTTTLTVGGVGAELVPYLDKAADSTDVLALTIRIFLSDDPDAPHFILDGLTGKSVDVGVFDVAMTAGFEDFLNAPFGKAIYTTRDYPGLDR